MTSSLEQATAPKRRLVRWLTRGVLALLLAYLVYAVINVTSAADQADADRDTTCTVAYAHDGGDAARLRDALTGVRSVGAGQALADLAPVKWDVVYAFPASVVAARPGDPGSLGVDVDELVGCQATLPYRADFGLGSVLFFVHDGTVVQALEVGHPLVGNRGPWRWPQNTRVEPLPPSPECPGGCLRLVGVAV
ncbi:MAG TPA: hypothetical protein VLH10_23515 [Yinghuangia sp.]|uniref:hypothetical protein n=1 Tax=Yinghuangia sp. YIM S10712 TaxID=3436930 RepID=UPI002BA2EFDD|nr:hypothetical protein [Yinghuangia sp.]